MLHVRQCQDRALSGGQLPFEVRLRDKMRLKDCHLHRRQAGVGKGTVSVSSSQIISETQR